MQIATNRISQVIVLKSSDPEVQQATDNLSGLLDYVLEYLPQIGSYTEFIDEYGAQLSMAVDFIQEAYAALQKITDPNVLASPAYKTILADLTTKTNPSLIDAANNPDRTVLARLLLQMKGIKVQPLTISQFIIDINRFVHINS